jgi:O-methyltransferase
MLQSIKRTLKRTSRSAVRRLGYEMVPMKAFDAARAISPAAAAGRPRSRSQEEEHERVIAALSISQTMRKIHCRDALEIEELYRHFLFPDLPRREGRAELLNDLIGTTVSEAVYIIRFLHEALQVPGDICEFGVAQGATSCILAAEIMSTSRIIWLFDSFEGLPAPGPKDKLINDVLNLGSMRRYKGTMASPETAVLSKLDAIGFPRERTKVRKGWIKETLRSGELPDQIAFAYVDFDFYEPIKDALSFLDTHMPPGGRILVDDYGFFSQGAQLAVDEFIAAAGNRFSFETPLPFAGHFCILRKV